MGKYKVEICGVNTATLPVLKSQQMTELFVQLQNGDLSAKEKLINGNLKLVLSIVQRFAHRTENMDDLFQIGCIGLIKAIDNFDLSHEVRFSTYAVPMIIGEIKRYLRDNQMIRVSRHLKDLAYKVLKEKEAFIHANQREPSLAELAEIMGVKEKEIAESLESLQSVVSIFEPIYNDDGDTLYLLDQIKDGPGVAPGKKRAAMSEKEFLTLFDFFRVDSIVCTKIRRRHTLKTGDNYEIQ